RSKVGRLLDASSSSSQRILRRRALMGHHSGVMGYPFSQPSSPMMMIGWELARNQVLHAASLVRAMLTHPSVAPEPLTWRKMPLQLPGQVSIGWGSEAGLVPSLGRL